MKKINQYQLILLTAFFWIIFNNPLFFSNLTKVFPLEGLMILFVLSVGILVVFLNTFLISLVASKYTTKPLLILITLVSAFTNYFMNTYNVVIDYTMIQNSLQTNFHESLDLLSVQLVVYVVLLGLIPSYVIYKTPVEYSNISSQLFLKLKYTIVSLAIIAGVLFSFSKYYTSFFREHKPLRYYTNPTYWIYSIYKYIEVTANSIPKEMTKIGLDAKIDSKDYKKRQIVIMVVGEAARADRFELNGYSKNTNPLLKNQDIINLSNISSCGTTTAISVPCMFSYYGREDYNYKNGISTYNVVDVLNQTNQINILWRDNNSDSKGVALRVPFEDYRTNATNTICDIECRDEGMLVGLDEYIKTHNDKDILIILHQMGNHGPAYYKRYPKEFEKFTPVCKTNQLEQCSVQEISNAYDNVILYTDYFLDKTINFLKQYDKTHETAMLYMADHGESLGENGLYLHGIPYFMAPSEQTHVASLVWFGKQMKQKIDLQKLSTQSDTAWSHDNLFHTLLGIFDVQTSVYDSKLDILNHFRKETSEQ